MDIFENICRTCGNDCLEAMHIFLDSVLVLEKQVPISEIILKCLPASASLPPLNNDDDFPKQICRVCIKKLTMIYEFNTKWLAANNEFNVALKFEQRRNRSRSQTQSQFNPPQLPMKAKPADAAGNVTAAGQMVVNEPSDFIEDVNCETEVNYRCAFCPEGYSTFAAYRMHHKAIHRNCQFVCYTP
ncbi:GH17762 [Drosophila grimshawi]|uniref:GH17762 n=2 Tax=Drosophila grimshawi TaxID=7222 RepID=B4JXL8_DROGR|nr:GH17762 [Drosophila grimshawi]